MSSNFVEKSHHLDVGVIVHNQGVVATKFQQVLAPPVEKLIKKGLIRQFSNITYLGQPLPQTCQPANKRLSYTAVLVQTSPIDTNLVIQVSCMWGDDYLGGSCEADQLDPLVVCHLHTHICARLNDFMQNMAITYSHS